MDFTLLNRFIEQGKFSYASLLPPPTIHERKLRMPVSICFCIALSISVSLDSLILIYIYLISNSSPEAHGLVTVSLDNIHAMEKQNGQDEGNSIVISM